MNTGSGGGIKGFIKLGFTVCNLRPLGAEWMLVFTGAGEKEGCLSTDVCSSWVESSLLSFGTRTKSSEVLDQQSQTL